MDSFARLVENLGAQIAAHLRSDYRIVLNRLLGMLESPEIEDIHDYVMYAQQVVPLLRSVAARSSPQVPDVAAVCGAFASPATSKLLGQYGAALTPVISAATPLKVLYFSAMFNVGLALTRAGESAQQMRGHLRRQAKGSARTIFDALGCCVDIDDYVKYGVDVHKDDRLALILLISSADCIRRGIPLDDSADGLDIKHNDEKEPDPAPKRRRVLSNARNAGKRARIIIDDDSGCDSDDIHAPPPRPTYPDMPETERAKLAAWLGEFYAKDLRRVCQRLYIDVGYVKDDHIDSIIEALGNDAYTHPALEWQWCRN